MFVARHPPAFGASGRGGVSSGAGDGKRKAKGDGIARAFDALSQRVRALVVVGGEVAVIAFHDEHPLVMGLRWVFLPKLARPQLRPARHAKPIENGNGFAKQALHGSLKTGILRRRPLARRLQ